MRRGRLRLRPRAQERPKRVRPQVRNRRRRGASRQPMVVEGDHVVGMVQVVVVVGLHGAYGHNVVVAGVVVRTAVVARRGEARIGLCAAVDTDRHGVSVAQLGLYPYQERLSVCRRLVVAGIGDPLQAHGGQGRHVLAVGATGDEELIGRLLVPTVDLADIVLGVVRSRGKSSAYKGQF